MKLTQDEKNLIEVFKSAGFSGRIFRSSSDAEKWALSDQRAVQCFYDEKSLAHPGARDLPPGEYLGDSSGG